MMSLRHKLQVTKALNKDFVIEDNFIIQFLCFQWAVHLQLHAIKMCFQNRSQNSCQIKKPVQKAQGCLVSKFMTVFL